LNRQIRLVGVGIMVLFVVLFAQLNWVQVFHAAALNNNPLNSRRITKEYDTPRGNIVSADGQLLAYSKAITGNFKYERVYPFKSLFGQITGYFSFTYGSDGVEKSDDRFLTGASAQFKLPTSLSQLQNELANASKAENVTLTISAKLQAVAARALGRDTGAVVALDPQTGAILAMYANPSFDPNLLSGSNSQQVVANWNTLVKAAGNPLSSGAYRNRFPPGSTFKMVTASAVYDHDSSLATKNYPVTAQLVLPQTNNQVLGNFGGESCGGQLAHMFTVSCDTGFANVGLDLGASNLAAEANAFGFDAVPPLDLPAAAPSNFPAPASFSQDLPGLAKSAIGQENVSASPLEMAMVAGALGNGGNMMVPHVLKNVTNSQNQVVSTYQAKVWRQSTSAQTAATMKTLMLSVVNSNDGTGTAARIPGVMVAGKTGTAQTGVGTTDDWFAAYAPAGDPQIAVCAVVLNQPTADQYQGGIVAAPIARAVMEAALTPSSTSGTPTTTIAP
jgi:peptidoglycan glycosyltransferase